MGSIPLRVFDERFEVIALDDLAFPVLCDQLLGIAAEFHALDAFGIQRTAEENGYSLARATIVYPPFKSEVVITVVAPPMIRR